MKFARFFYGKQKNRTEAWGIIAGESVEIISNTPFEDWETTGKKVKIYEVRFAAPCIPTKIICSGLNYPEHAAELNIPVPAEPLIFMKPMSSVLGPEGNIVKPSGCSKLDYEAELAIVIKKKMKNVKIEDVGEYILGYTCMNDVTARDQQLTDRQWTRAKSYDTFAPLGPVIAAGIDPNRLKIELFLNEKLKQSASTADLIIKAEKLASMVSGYMTLFPGDVISTGTPAGMGEMVPGDVVEVVIEKIGTLRNYVTEQKL